MTGDEYDRRLGRDIMRHGWTVQHVDGDGDRNPSFAYTLGLSLHGHPEFIVFDCFPNPAYRALEPLAIAVLAGRRFDEGGDLSGLYVGRPQLLRLPDSTTHLLTANDMFRQPGGPPIRALQLLWPTSVRQLADVIDRPDRDEEAR
ncbi:DUF4262 domain-containing protein [Kribbella qitaiheensis]|nr:DUF4262 domain-containing protein [Kribbella qitaiheensis]